VKIIHTQLSREATEQIQLRVNNKIGTIPFSSKWNPPGDNEQ